MSRPAPQSLAVEVRRMAPVWAIIFVTAAGSLGMIHWRGAKYLETGYLESGRACDVADLHYQRARKAWRTLSGQVAQSQVGRRDLNSLGRLKGDPLVAKTQKEVLTAIELCPIQAGFREMLADLYWWDGDEGTAYYYQSLEQSNLGQYDTALALIQAAREKNPSKPEFQLAELELAVHQKRWDAAEQTLASLEPGMRESLEALRTEAQLAFAQDRPKEGVAVARKALELSPGDRDMIELVCQGAYQFGNLVEEGRFLLENMHKSRAPLPELYHKIALLFISAKDYDGAIAALDDAITVQPNAVMLYVEKSFAQYYKGDYDGARITAELALGKDAKTYMESVDLRGLDPSKGK